MNLEEVLERIEHSIDNFYEVLNEFGKFFSDIEELKTVVRVLKSLN